MGAPNMPPGSPCYVAPEVILRAQYDYRVDLYSFGVLVWVVLTGGLISEKDPRPPCASRLSLLGRNWELLADTIMDPEGHDAQELPSTCASDLVLKCINRGSGYTPITHDDIREHAFFCRLPPLPQCGDDDALKVWLQSLYRLSEDLWMYARRTCHSH